MSRSDNTIHRINVYSVDNAIGFPNTYPPGMIYPVESAIECMFPDV